MKILVYGSLNIDKTYTMPHIVREGETISALSMQLFRGGKGYNQAISFARAGSKVAMAGAVGTDGDFLLEPLEAEGVEISGIKRTEGASGHAVIQVDTSGRNAIWILPGANGEITEGDVDKVLAGYGAGDLIVLQNETACLPYMIAQAHAKGMRVALNASPLTEQLKECGLDKVDFLLVNEKEAAALGGADSSPAEPDSKEDFDAILERLHARFPAAHILMTLGHRGAIFLTKEGERATCGIYPVKAVDTTAAGDTYTGYFLSEYLRSGNAQRSLQRAAIASGISVSRPGASPSIPYAAEVDAVDFSEVKQY